jgi:hypothetical protein
MAMICPSGDPRQAVLMPWAPNKNYKAPDHANKSGQDEEVYQMEDLRVSKGKDGYDIWLEEPEQDNQQGGAGGGGGGEDQQEGGQQERKTGGDKARMKLRIHNDGGITARLGKDVRVHVHKDGAKLKVKENIVLLDKNADQVKVKSQNPPLVNKAWQVQDWEDPIQNDDK